MLFETLGGLGGNLGGCGHYRGVKALQKPGGALWRIRGLKGLGALW